MKLQRRLSRIYKGKKYFKYLIVIPEKEIENAKLNEGDELSIESSEKKLTIRKL